MSIEGQGHFFTIYFPGFVCFVLYLAKISGERLQDHWSSGYSSRIRTLVAMATYSFNRLIMGKKEIGNFDCLIGDNRILFLQKCLLNSSPLL